MCICIYHVYVYIYIYIYVNPNLPIHPTSDTISITNRHVSGDASRWFLL